MLKLVPRFTQLCIVSLLASLLLLPLAGNTVNAANTTTVINNISAVDNNKHEGEFDNWSSWGHDLLNTRFQPFAEGINTHNVSNLKLKWSFVFPDATSASSQPAVVDNTLYVGGWNGKFYALDAKTGQQKWSYDTASFTGSQLPTGTSRGVRTGAVVVRDRVYFGDFLANFYALDAKTGTLIWAKKIDNFPFARFTGSPVFWQGHIYIGISSIEEGFAIDPTYPCCTFRGSVVALDAQTGNVAWRYYTIAEPPHQTGTNTIGTPTYGPSGVAVWSSPALDPLTGTLYITTGNNYTEPTTDRSDSIIALDSRTGKEKWAVQLTPNDRWNLSCTPQSIGLPPGAGPNCPPPNISDDDFDFGYSPNIFLAVVNGKLRTLVGAGQKSGIYHALDAQTGQIVWQRQLSANKVSGGIGGIQWGGSWDGARLYIATQVANPGTLFALDPATGNILWHTPNPSYGCTSGGAATTYANQYPCQVALPAAVTTIPGIAFEGSWDGKFRAYNSVNGATLWSYDTIQTYVGTNDVSGHGGSINGAGATVAAGMVYVNSGYEPFPHASIPGNVLLAFGLDK